jgi:Fe-S cluster biogenesis protein NfuA
MVESHNHEVGVSDDEKLRQLIAALNAYIEQYHGGSVEMIEWSDDVLKVRLGGACEGCDLSQATLKGWIGGTVRQFFPQLKDVVAV